MNYHGIENKMDIQRFLRLLKWKFFSTTDMVNQLELWFELGKNTLLWQLALLLKEMLFLKE